MSASWFLTAAAELLRFMKITLPTTAPSSTTPPTQPIMSAVDDPTHLGGLFELGMLAQSRFRAVTMLQSGSEQKSWNTETSSLKISLVQMSSSRMNSSRKLAHGAWTKHAAQMSRFAAGRVVVEHFRTRIDARLRHREV